jgi:hypothetical protein
MGGSPMNDQIKEFVEQTEAVLNQDVVFGIDDEIHYTFIPVNKSTLIINGKEKTCYTGKLVDRLSLYEGSLPRALEIIKGLMEEDADKKKVLDSLEKTFTKSIEKKDAKIKSLTAQLVALKGGHDNG